MTVEELFHHDTVFVGCLAVRRAPDGRIALQTQGHDYPSLGACPARDAAGSCSVHADRKPGMCSVVPLDPGSPMTAQRVVLQRRHAESAFIEADCIVPGTRADHAPLVDGDRIVDADYLDAFERHREALGLEHLRWGRDVLDWMRPELARMHVASGGYLALSMAPVLIVLARASQAQRERCTAYAQAQTRLIEVNVARALRRRVAGERAFTEELRRFAAQYRQFVASA
jgi:hypothetical protein